MVACTFLERPCLLLLFQLHLCISVLYLFVCICCMLLLIRTAQWEQPVWVSVPGKFHACLHPPVSMQSLMALANKYRPNVGSMERFRSLFQGIIFPAWGNGFHGAPSDSVQWIVLLSCFFSRLFLPYPRESFDFIRCCGYGAGLNTGTVNARPSLQLF